MQIYTPPDKYRNRLCNTVTIWLKYRLIYWTDRTQKKINICILPPLQGTSVGALCVILYLPCVRMYTMFMVFLRGTCSHGYLAKWPLTTCRGRWWYRFWQVVTSSNPWIRILKSQIQSQSRQKPDSLWTAVSFSDTHPLAATYMPLMLLAKFITWSLIV